MQRYQMFEDVAHSLHRLLQHLFDFIVMNRIFARTTSRRIIRYNADGGVAQTNFFRETGFRHTRHADHGCAITLQPINLRPRFQTRALHGCIDTAIDTGFTGIFYSTQAKFAHILAIRFGEVHVHHRRIFTFTISRLPSMRVIDNLIGNDNRAGFQIGVNTTNRCHRYQILHTTRMYRPDVRAVVHVMRRDSMAIAVTR